jgi:hypothetical protein
MKKKKKNNKRDRECRMRKKYFNFLLNSKKNNTWLLFLYYCEQFIILCVSYLSSHQMILQNPIQLFWVLFQFCNTLKTKK